MFSKRADGRILKNLDPYDKALCYVMSRRSDAHVYFTEEIDCKYFDEYIAQKKAEGKELTYLHILMVAIVRVHAQRPWLNRFVMNGRIFARNELTVSMAVKKSLRDTSTSTTVKLPFTGHENIFEIADRIDQSIFETKEVGSENKTDRLAARVMNAPPLLIKLMVWAIKLLDRWNLLPKAIIDASPFHTSVFITYLKSVGINGIYHHIYDFGTTGMFIGVGKEIFRPVIDEETGEIRPGKVIELKVVADERFCDGLYHARSMRLVRKYLKNPALLEERLETVEKDID